MLNDINFDSELLFYYNLSYKRVHGKSLSFDIKDVRLIM